MAMDHTCFGRGGLLSARLIVGFGIALFGVVLVLDRLNLVSAGEVLRWWPVVLIALGAVVFRQSRRAGGSGANGVILTLVGAWFLLNSVGFLRVRFWDVFWPLVLIAVGSMLVMQALRRRDRQLPGAASDDTLSIFTVLGGVKRTSASQRFRGGEVTALMGGLQIDLRQAAIAPGEEAVIDAFIVMGGGEIFVPPGWDVVTPIVPILGGVDDQRLAPLPGADAAAGSAAPRLVLRGLLMMGGLEIKS